MIGGKQLTPRAHPGVDRIARRLVQHRRQGRDAVSPMASDDRGRVGSRARSALRASDERGRRAAQRSPCASAPDAPPGPSPGVA
ncbi:MAG: hypothetical protein MZW92_64165 [Comamonadaceae bacterium]|nr:hypothetical protein [Comamonadaceae bacterium]